MNAKTSKKALDEITKALNSMAATSEKVAAATEKQTKAFNEMSKATKDATKATKDADSELKRFKGNVEDTEDALTDVEKKMGKIKDQAAKFAKAAGFKASAKFEVKGFDKIGADLESYKDQLKDAQAQLKTMQEQDAGPGVFKDAQRGIQELNQKIRGLEGELKIVGDEFKTSLEVPRTPTRALGNINQGVEGIGSAFGALKKSPMEFAEHMESAQAAAHKLKASSAIIGKMPGLLGAMGKAAAGVAGAMGGITKVLAGWPGLVAMAVIKIVQAGVEIDTYLKTLNKRFAEIRGPQIMTGDLKKQFNDFNNAIFSLGDNIRDGLNADQVYDFMAALGTTGKRLTTLNEGFSNYRDAVHIAAKASKVFGMDITTVGAMMGRFTSDFGMNLEDVDDAFVQLSFDAQRSGLSTDRFLGAIENASVGLSFYGSFIGTASRMMSEFTKTQVMGAKDAADATQDITQAFGKMTTQEGMALLQVSGATDEARRAFQDIKKEAGKKAQEAGAEIIELTAKMDLATKPEKDEIAKKIDQLRTEQNKNMEMSDRAQGAINGGVLGMGQNLGILTDKSPKFFMELIKKVARTNDITKLNGAQLEVAMRGVDTVTNGKINAKLVQKLVAETTAMGATLKVVTGSVEGTTKEGKVNNKNLVGFLKKINKTIVKGDKHAKISAESNIAATEQEAADANAENGANAQLLVDSLKNLDITKAAESTAVDSKEAAEKAEATAKAVNNTAGVLKNLLGVDEDAAKSLAMAAAIDAKFNTGMQELIAASIEGKIAPEQMQKKMSDLISSSGIQTKFMVDQLTADKAVAKDQQAAYDDTFKGIRNMTLSIEDMKKIAGNEIEWRIKSLGFFQNMSDGISTMAANYADKAQTANMKKASDALKNAGLVLSGGIGKNEKIKGIDVSGKKVDTTTAKYTKELMTQNDTLQLQNKNTKKGLDDLEKNESKLSDAEIKQQKKILAEQMTKAQKQISQNNETLTLLQMAGGADQDMIDLYTAQLKGGVGGNEALLDIARKKFPGQETVSLKELENVPRIGKDLAQAARDSNKVLSMSFSKGKFTGRAEETVSLVKGTEKTDVAKKAGMKSPEKVTHEGPVILHPGETILPKLMSGFKTEPSNFSMMKPGIMEQSKAAPAATPVNISINVSADTKDLAQQIAMVAKNEIRGYFYNNSVNNQA